MPVYRQNNRFASKGALPKRPRETLAHGAPRGTRNKELFSAAVQFRDAGYSMDEAIGRLLDRALKDQLSEPEARKAIESAYTRGARAPIAEANSHSNTANSGPSRPSSGAGPAPAFHVVGGSIPLPDAIPDGFTRLLTAAFEPAEYVSIAEAEDDGGGNWMPKA